MKHRNTALIVSGLVVLGLGAWDYAGRDPGDAWNALVVVIIGAAIVFAGIVAQISRDTDDDGLAPLDGPLVPQCPRCGHPDRWGRDPFTAPCRHDFHRRVAS